MQINSFRQVGCPAVFQPPEPLLRKRLVCQDGNIYIAERVSALLSYRTEEVSCPDRGLVRCPGSDYLD